MEFASTDEELSYLRAVLKVHRLADAVLEECLQRQLGLEAAVDVFLAQAGRLLGACAGYVEVRGSQGTVLERRFGRLGPMAAEARHWQGTVALRNGHSLLVSQLTLGSLNLGVLALQLPQKLEAGQLLPQALVEAMAEELDGAVLSFLALGDGQGALERLSQLGSDGGFRPRGRLGKYRLLAPLGAGGMAQVMVARTEGPEGLGRLVALKRMLPSLAEDEQMVNHFLDEARVCLRLSHPNLVTLYEFGEASGAYYLALELVRGVTLEDVLGQEGLRLPVPLALSVVHQALTGLQAAHQARDEQGGPLGLVHRDISPQNLMLGFDGRVKVLDFGVAKARAQRTVTLPGLVKGKPAYMSPEQAQGQEVDLRSDLFSLGLVAFEALTGEHPFPGREGEAVMDAIIDEHLERHPAIPSSVWRALRQALDKRPEHRFGSARAMAQALEEAIEPAPEEALGQFLQSHFPLQQSRFAQWERSGL